MDLKHLTDEDLQILASRLPEAKELTDEDFQTLTNNPSEAQGVANKDQWAGVRGMIALALDGTISRDELIQSPKFAKFAYLNQGVLKAKREQKSMGVQVAPTRSAVDPQYLAINSTALQKIFVELSNALGRLKQKVIEKQCAMYMPIRLKESSGMTEFDKPKYRTDVMFFIQEMCNYNDKQLIKTSDYIKNSLQSIDSYQTDAPVYEIGIWLGSDESLYIGVHHKDSDKATKLFWLTDDIQYICEILAKYAYKQDGLINMFGEIVDNEGGDPDEEYGAGAF